MLKFRTILVAIMAATVWLSLSVAANAQLPQSVVNQLTPQYSAGGRFHICRDPWITIAISDIYGGTRNVNGSGDAGECNAALYGGQWSNYAGLYQLVKNALNSGAFTVTRQTLADGTIKLTTDFGQGFVRNEIISHDGGTLLTSDGAGIMVNQGSNVISDGSATLIGNNGSTFKRTLLSAGDELRINLGTYSLLLLIRGGGNTTAGNQSVDSSGNQSGRSSDDQIRLCLNNRNGAFRAVTDWLPSRPSITVAGGTVYLSGSVPNQSYKDQLANAARACNARAVNLDRLKVGN